MNYKSMSNNKLLSELKAKVENERKLLMEILYALREIEVRNLHLELGYPDLYEFAMKELGYSSGSAYRRIAAMRLLKSVPEIAPKLESGELGLENASQAQSFFRKEDQRRKEQGEQKLTLEEKHEVVTELLGKSTREGQRLLMEKSPDVMIPSEKTRPLPEQKTLVQFIATSELMAKLEELKNWMAHKNFEGRMDVLIDQLADIALSEFRPKPPSKTESQSTSKPRSDQAGLKEHADKAKYQQSSALSPYEQIELPAPGIRNSAQPTTKRSRYIRAAEKREVLIRDQKGCTYKDIQTRRVCQSKHGLQLDHIVPFSLGGQNTAENLTLRCGAHNRYRAKQMGLSLEPF